MSSCKRPPAELHHCQVRQQVYNQAELLLLDAFVPEKCGLGTQREQDPGLILTPHCDGQASIYSTLPNTDRLGKFYKKNS